MERATTARYWSSAAASWKPKPASLAAVIVEAGAPLTEQVDVASEQAYT